MRALRSSDDPVVPRLRQLLTEQSQATLWERDTALLAPALQQYRRRMRDFARSVLSPFSLGADADPSGFDRALVLRLAARAGVLTDHLPRPLGTGGAFTLRHSPVMLAHLRLEELCAACGGLGLLLGATDLGMCPILLSGELGAIRRFIWPALQSTKRGKPSLFAYAITEPGAGSDVQDTAGARTARLGTRARKIHGGWQISGRKCFISDGDVADRFCVFAALEDEGIESWTCFLVERWLLGFSIGRHEHKLGQRAAAAVELTLENVFVPHDHVIGGLRGGWALNRATLAQSRGPVGAIALGIARGAVEAAMDVARRTTVARRPLIEHEDVGLALADMWIELDAARSLLWQTASRLPPHASSSATAKTFCAESAWRVCTRAMEVLGDLALFHENRVEKAFRDVRLTQIYEGTNEINRLALLEAQWQTDIACTQAKGG